MKPIYWIPLAVVLVAVLFFIISYLNPPSPSQHTAGPPLARRAEKAVQLNIEQQHERAKNDTLAAAALTASAHRTTAAAQALGKQALVIHQKSRSHATPVPTTDTAVARLQRVLATYGD